jgi:hypothetical protein
MKKERETSSKKRLFRKGTASFCWEIPQNRLERGSVTHLGTTSLAGEVIPEILHRASGGLDSREKSFPVSGIDSLLFAGEIAPRWPEKRKTASALQTCHAESLD